MKTTSLKWREDLVVSEQQVPEGILFVIKDPVTDRFFRFSEIEYFIARQFDGTQPEEMIPQLTREKFGIEVSPEDIKQFEDRLQQAGLLSDDTDEEGPKKSRRRRMAGDIFYLRYRLFNPDKLFNWLLPKTSFFFTPWFIVLSAILGVYAFVITVARWPEISTQFYELFRLESLLMVWVVLLVVVTLHEFAHGLTCRHFGGRVREIGFMLIYFQPAFYCNVSDAWLFPKKSQRLWVTFAGAYFEIFLWALATLLWRIFDPATTFNHLALIVVGTSAVKSFFNMNPLIKLDGYYLLSDWLGIPNLRKKAFDYLGNQFKKLWGAGNDYFAGYSYRQKCIFLVYALLAGVYTYWLLSYIIMWFGELLVSRYQGWGFVIFIAILCLFFRKPVKKILSPVISPLQLAWSRSTLMFKRFRIWLIAALLVAFLFLYPMELKVSGSFKVLPEHNADVRAEAEGIIEEVYADEGSIVKKGAVIARLSDLDYTMELQKTLAEIETKQAALKLLKSGPRLAEIRLAETQVNKAAEHLRFASSNLKRYNDLYKVRAVSGKEFEEVQELAAMRRRELQSEQERLKLVRAGSRPEEIEGLQANINSLYVQKQYLETQIKSLVLISPIDGVVTTPKLKEKIGENVKRGDLVAEVHDLKNIKTEISVSEKEIGDVRPGQKVVLKARAYPGDMFSGKVDRIAPAIIENKDTPQDKTVTVTTYLANHDYLLKPEMTGHAKIYCGERRVIEILGRRVIRYFRVEFWSWW